MHFVITITFLWLSYRFRRLTYVTPKSYLAFINGYKAIYSKKRADISGLETRINSGLKKLKEATGSVNILKIDLAEKEKELLVKSAEVDKVFIMFFYVNL